MNWENIDCFEEEKEASSSQNGVSTEDMSVESDDKKFLQLAKFQDPIANITRQEYITLMNRFGEFITNQDLEEMKNEIFTENCMLFLLNFFDDPRVTYSQGSQNVFKTI